MPRIVSFALTALAALTVAACERAVYPTGFAPSSSTMTARSDAVEVPAAEAGLMAPAESGVRTLPSAESISDTVITGKVKTSLATDPALAGADVSVNTYRGVVNLTGVVQSQEQAAIASAHAQGQDGVMRIDNHLAVNLR
jgi:osmotically-inducible protein OsmY